MDNENGISPNPRHVWPRYLLAAALVAVVLAVLWMAAEVQRTRQRRAANPLPGTKAHETRHDTNAVAVPTPPPGPAPAELDAWRAELNALAHTNAPEADAALSAWLDRLRAGEVPKEIRFDVLEAARQRQAPALQAQLARYEAAWLPDDPLAGFRETLYGGNAEAGRNVFFVKPEASCGRCHKARGEGGENGPVLDGLGARQTREYLLESILYPNACAVTNYETVVVLLKNGTFCAGVLRNENDAVLSIHTADEGLVTIRKSDVQLRERGLSPMPEGIWQLLSKRDIRDLIEFIASLP